MAEPVPDAVLRAVRSIPAGNVQSDTADQQETKARDGRWWFRWGLGVAISGHTLALVVHILEKVQ